MVGFWWGPSSGSLTADFSLCPHMVGGVRELCGVSFIRALIPFMRAPPLWPNHPKVSISKYHHIRISTYEFWVGGHKHLDHNKGLRLCQTHHIAIWQFPAWTTVLPPFLQTRTLRPTEVTDTSWLEAGRARVWTQAYLLPELFLFTVSSCHSQICPPGAKGSQWPQPLEVWVQFHRISCSGFPATGTHFLSWFHLYLLHMPHMSQND